MNLMLAVLVVCVAIGLLSPRFTVRTYWYIAAVATTMTGLFFFTTRFMT
jgi:hypothetical protein